MSLRYAVRGRRGKQRAISRQLADAWEPAGRFEVCRHAVYLGFEMGPQASAHQWKAVCDKFRRKTASMAASSPPVAAVPSMAQTRLVSLWRYLGSLVPPPADLERLERDAWARLLKLPGSSVPLQGVRELAQWGWPAMPSLTAAIDASARATASRAGTTWSKYEMVLMGVPTEALPLSHYASGVDYDERWDSPPMVSHLATHVGPPVPLPAPRVLVAEAIAQRMARVVPAGTSAFSDAVLKRLRSFTVGATQHWAVTTLRFYLNFWVTSCRMQIGDPDSCLYG